MILVTLLCMPPSALHEGIVELIRRRPRLPAELLTRALGVNVPEFAEARVVSGSLPRLKPAERHADAVVILYASCGEPVLVIAVEVQLRRDDRKHRSWPDYLTGLSSRYDCGAMLLVVAPGRQTAAWAARPIHIGHPWFILWPLVAGPDAIPVVSDPAEARTEPELAILSGIAHGRDKLVRNAAFIAVSEIAGEDVDLAALYAEVILDELPKALRKTAEDELRSYTIQYRSEFAKSYFSQGVEQGREQGREQGKAEGTAVGEAMAVLAVLDARGFCVPRDERQRILTCRDVDQLDHWVRLAATAESIADLFA